MEYEKAFIKLYGAAGAAIEELFRARVVPPELDSAIKILKEAIAAVEEMEEVNEENDPPLTPSFHGKNCLGNGGHEGVACCCDECDFYLDCFPDWRGMQS